MRLRLRTLLLALAILPILIGAGFHGARAIIDARERGRRTTCDCKLIIGVPRPPPMNPQSAAP